MEMIGLIPAVKNMPPSIRPLQWAIQGEQSLAKTENTLFGDSGFASILPFEHSMAIAYISSYQQDNHLIYVSRQIANLGFTPDAWLGKTDLRLQQVHEDDHDRLVQALQHSRDTGEKFNCYYRLYDSSGEMRWIHDEASVVRDESGAPLFARGVMLDITDKKEMEAELNGHRYYLERHVESRTEQLMRRMALLESCNASLGDKLALAKREVAALKQQLAAPAMRERQAAQLIPSTQTISDIPEDYYAEQLDGISDWARNMIGWRVAAAGAIA